MFVMSPLCKLFGHQHSKDVPESWGPRSTFCRHSVTNIEKFSPTLSPQHQDAINITVAFSAGPEQMLMLRDSEIAVSSRNNDLQRD